MSMKRAQTIPSVHISTTHRNAPPDSLDQAILTVLNNRARASNDAIGSQVGLSASAVSRRIHSMEKRGIINGYRVVVNENALGLSMTVFVRITLERQSAAALNAFEAAVKHCQNVLSCHLMAGEHDYMLLLRVQSMADYERIHQRELSRLPQVSRIESSFAVREVQT
jgi:Lrp/AsnC family leucine-responsive transcriptional regulator